MTAVERRPHFVDGDRAGRFVDAHLDDLRRVAEAHGRADSTASVLAALRLGWTGECSRCRDRTPVDQRQFHHLLKGKRCLLATHDTEHAAGAFNILRACRQFARCDLDQECSQSIRGIDRRIADLERNPGRVGPVVLGRDGTVASDHSHTLERQMQRLGDRDRHHRRGSLTNFGGARECRDAAIPVELDVDDRIRLPRPVDRFGRPTHVVGARDAKTLAGRQLPSALMPGTGSFHAIEALPEPVAVDHEVIGCAGRGLEQVGAAYCERIEMQLACHAVEQHFKGMTHIDCAVPAHRAARRQVGVHPIAVIFHRGNIVQTLQQCAGIENSDDAVASVGPAALHDFAFAGGHATVLLHPELQVGRRLRPAAMGQEALLAREFHQHLALRCARQQRRYDLEIENLDARTETAADEWLNEPDVRLVHLQAARQHEVQVVGDLRHALHGQAAGQRVEVRERGMQFHLRMIDFGAVDRRLAHQIGRCEACGDIAKDVVYRALDVAWLVVVQERGVRCARVLGCVVGRQRAHLEFYQFERACRGSRVDRRNRRYGLADVAHFVACQRIFIHGDRQHAIGVRAIGAGYRQQRRQREPTPWKRRGAGSRHGSPDCGRFGRRARPCARDLPCSAPAR